MLRYAYAITTLLAAANPALAQQRPDPDFLTAAITAMEAQRNSALNAQATAEARLMQANKEIAELKAKLEPKKEAPTDAKQKP